MPRTIVLDTFPLSSTARREAPPGVAPTALDLCQQWVKDCRQAGHRVLAPAISYYETLRELERLKATSQIARLRTFCHAVPGVYLPLTDDHLNLAAVLWGQARNAGTPTADPKELDGDVILAAQALTLGVPLSDLVVATTNVGHLAQFVPAELWTNIAP